MGSIAHSVVLLRAKPNSDIESIKTKIKESINPRKWICVGVDEKDIIFVRIDVLSGFSEFVFKTKAKISRKEGNETYAVEFLDMSKTNQIMLDEIIHANNQKFADDM